jgi:hypothetical protein
MDPAVEQQFSLGVHEGCPLEAGVDLAAARCNAAFKHTPDNTLLLPNLSFADFPIGIEACPLGAGPSAAGGTIVGLPGIEHEVLAVDRGQIGLPEQLAAADLLILAPVIPCSRNALRIAHVKSVNCPIFSSDSSRELSRARKNQRPPQASSPCTLP